MFTTRVASLIYFSRDRPLTEISCCHVVHKANCAVAIGTLCSFQSPMLLRTIHASHTVWHQVNCVLEHFHSSVVLYYCVYMAHVTLLYEQLLYEHSHYYSV